MEYEYSEVEILPVPRREYFIRKYSNFSIINPEYEGEEQEELYINQDAYIIPDKFPPHFHFVREILGQFAILKSIKPDIFAWLVSREDKTLEEVIPWRYKATLNGAFGVVEESFVNMHRNSKVTFKSISFIVTSANSVLEDAVDLVDIYTEKLTSEEQLQLHIDMYVEVSKAVETFKTVPKRNKKVYLCRRKEDKKVQQHLDDFFNYLKYGIKKVPIERRDFLELNLTQELAIYELGQAPYYTGMDATFIYAAERMFSEDEHDILETYYSSQGYEIIDASELHLNEQIALMSEASHVAALAGGGLVNAAFCSKDTEITILCPSNTFHSGGHSAPLDHIFPKLRVIPDRDESKRNYEENELNHKFPAAELIAQDALVRASETNGLSTPASQLINEGIS